MDSEISAFDKLENLRFSSYEINQLFSSLKGTLPIAMGSKLQDLSQKFLHLSNQWTQLCEELVEKSEEEKTKANEATKQEKIMKNKEKTKNFKRQKYLENKEIEIDKKTRELEQSVYNVKEIIKDNVNQLEKSLIDKNIKKKNREKEQISELNQFEDEMSTVLEKPILVEKSLDYAKAHASEDSINIDNISMIERDGPPIDINFSYATATELNVSEEFDKIIDEYAKNHPDIINSSKISIDKSIGGWKSDLESDTSNISIEIRPRDIELALNEFERLNGSRYEETIIRIRTLLSQGPESFELGMQLAKMLLKKNGIDIKPAIPTSKILTPMDSKNFNAPFASPDHFKNKQKQIFKEKIQESQQDLEMTSPRDLMYNGGCIHPMLEETDNLPNSGILSNDNIEAFLNSPSMEDSNFQDQNIDIGSMHPTDLETENTRFDDRILNSKDSGIIFRGMNSVNEPPSTKKKEIKSFSNSHSQSIMKTESCTKFQLDSSKGF